MTHVVYDSHFGYEYSRNGYAAFSKSASKKTNVGQLLPVMPYSTGSKSIIQ